MFGACLGYLQCCVLVCEDLHITIHDGSEVKEPTGGKRGKELAFFLVVHVYLVSLLPSGTFEKQVRLWDSFRPTLGVNEGFYGGVERKASTRPDQVYCRSVAPRPFAFFVRQIP